MLRNPTKLFKRWSSFFHHKNYRSLSIRVALAGCQNAQSVTPHAAEEMNIVIRALSRYGIAAEVRSWDCKETDWTGYKAVLLCQTWDYMQKYDSFIQWAEKVSMDSKLLNPLSVVKWSTNKIYLRDLSFAGVHILPTLWLNTSASLSEDVDDLAYYNHHITTELQRLNWSSIVIKPAIGADAYNVQNFDSFNAQALELVEKIGRSGQDITLVQPFVPSVITEGEVSLIYIEGEYAHAVLKRPCKGDFRVQEIYGGGSTSIDPTPKMLNVGDSVISALKEKINSAHGFPDEPLLYARIDLMSYVPTNTIDHDGSSSSISSDSDVIISSYSDEGSSSSSNTEPPAIGTWVIVEVELVEPSLYLLSQNSEGGITSSADKLAQAISKRITT